MIVLQSEKIDHLQSIIVAPVKRERPDLAIPSLTPLLVLDGVSYAILVPFMSAIDRRELDVCVGHNPSIDFEVTKALDRLFLGI
ncbi:MAG: hypothetical protein RLZZ157_1675 [Pseudomonadota bacterium]